MDPIQKPLKKRYKYRIYPTKDQEHQLAQLFGCCRKVFNHFLADRKEAAEKAKIFDDKSFLKSTSYFDLGAELTQLKKLPEYSYLNEVAAMALKYSVKRLADAFKNTFKYKRGYPRFKNRYDGKQSATFSKQFAYLKEGKLHLANFNSLIKIKLDRPLPDTFTECNVSRTPSGKYYASFVAEVPETVTNGRGFVGIDLGLKDLFTFSDGRTIVNPKRYQALQRKVARLNRWVARKKKGSKNREKAIKALAVVYERLVNVRKDFMHKLTTELTRQYEAIGMETLSVANMARNPKLSKHILDACWGMFRQLLMQKCQGSTGCTLVLADPFYPSTQLCHICSTPAFPKLTLKDRSWTCQTCHSHHDRDGNAAKNLENLARRYGSVKDPQNRVRLLIGLG